MKTRVGYAGGTTSAPTYYNIGDHSETVQVIYDPAIVSYEQLLAAFWGGHNAASPGYTAQYRSAIFYNTEEQYDLANKSRAEQEIQLGQNVYTAIEPYTNFYFAEDYHQKYLLRQKSDLVNELYAIYPEPVDFRDSTAVARLNGYVGGYGDLNNLVKNIDRLGLSESGKQELLRITESGLTPVCHASICGEKTE